MQLGFGMVSRAVLLLPLAGLLGAQTSRGFGRLVSHEVEVMEGCGAAVRRLTLAPGQPLPIPLPIVCGGSTVRFNRLRLPLPARTDPGSLNGQQIALDSPLTVSYDVAAEWTGGVPLALRAEIGDADACSDRIGANLNAQTSRVCEWTSFAATGGGFTVVSQFSLLPAWSLRSIARYIWTAAPSIGRVELVQAVQTDDQRVPLYAGKPTQVRVFPAGSAGVATRVQLYVQYGPKVWRYTAPRTVIAPAQVNRNSDARSFLIPLPEEVSGAVGSIGIDAQLLTAEGRLLTALAKPVTAEFIEAPRASPVGYLRVCESSSDGRDRVCPDAAPQILGAIAEQILPVAVLPQSLLGTAVVPSGVDAPRRLLRLRQSLEEVQNLVLVLPDPPSSPEQLTNWLAKAYGVTASTDTGRSVGFDLRSGSIVPGWASAATVDALAARLRARPLQPPVLSGAVEFLSVSGTVASDRLSGALGHGFRSATALATPPSDPAAPACLLLTSPGGESTSYCFALDQEAFAVRIPWLAGARQLALVYDGVELATRTLSASPPQAEILTPQAGNRIPEGPVLVQWSGSDADGDPLRYDLLISTDGGASWVPIVCELDRTDFTIDTSMFPTSARVMLQLRFSDGLQSASVTTGLFEFMGAGGQLQAPANVTLPAMLAGQPAEAVVSIANTGSGTLFIDSGMTSNSAVQLVAPAFPVQVAPGASTPLRLRVTPPALGAFSATLALDAAKVIIDGRGVNSRGPQLEHSPASLDFGTVMLGQSRDIPLTIGNGGGAPLTVTPPATLRNFHLSGFDGPLTLPPGGQQRVTVRFQPAAAGSAFEILLLDGREVPLSGHAVEAVVANDPRIEVRPAPSADFGNVRIGVPVQQTFTLRNSGRVPLVITQISATPSDYSVRDFPAVPFTLAPNAEQLFFVRIDATATGARLGQLQFNSNDPANPVLRIGLSAVASLPVTGTVVLAIDDGTFERQTGFPSGDGFFLSRLKPSAYPATLKAIRVYFGERCLEPGEGFGLLWAAHPTGTEELPGNLRMQSSAAVVRNPAEFVEYPVTPMTIESGDFLVGFQSSGPTAAALDTSTNLTPTRSYASRDGGSWRQSVLWPGFPSGVFAVRAVVDVGRAILPAGALSSATNPRF